MIDSEQGGSDGQTHLQQKIVLTNLHPTKAKVDEVDAV